VDGEGRDSRMLSVADLRALPAVSVTATLERTATAVRFSIRRWPDSVA
jgi:hypothetical protein